MLTQTVQSTSALPVVSESFIHLVTLIHRTTRQERSFEVVTATDRFCDVLREVSHQKFIRGLAHYEIFEALPLQCPLPF